MALLTPADITSWTSQGMVWTPCGAPQDYRHMEWKYLEALRQATLERMEVHRAGTVETSRNTSTPTQYRYWLIHRPYPSGDPSPVAPFGRDCGDHPIYRRLAATEFGYQGIGIAIDLSIRKMISDADASFDGSFRDLRRNWAIPATAGFYNDTSDFPFLTKAAIESIIGEELEFITCGAPVTWKWAYQMYQVLNLMVHYGCRIQLGAYFTGTPAEDPEAEATLVVTKRPAGSWSSAVAGNGSDLPSSLADLASNWASASTSTFTGPAAFADKYAKSQVFAYFPTQVQASAQECVGASCSSWDVVPSAAAYEAEVDYYSRARTVGNNVYEQLDPKVFDNQAQDPTLSPIVNRLTFLDTVLKPAGDRYCPAPKIGDISIPPDFCPTTEVNYGVESGTQGINSLFLPNDVRITNIGIHRYDIASGFRFQA